VNIRDELATLLNDTDPEGGIDPDDEFADQQFWYPQVDAILLSPAIRRIQAEVLRDCAGQAVFNLGTPGNGHTSVYSVRKWLNDEANRIERGA
jgi:hypothetical protein